MAKESVVIAVDGSADSRSALMWALETVASLKGKGQSRTQDLSVHLVHVVRPEEDFILDVPEMTIIPKATTSDALRASAARGEHVLRDAERVWEAECQKRGLHGAVQRHLAFGDPKEKLLGVVAEVDAGLLVVGKRGLSPWQKLWMGSVSDFCTTHSPCPVACVPKQ